MAADNLVGLIKLIMSRQSGSSTVEPFTGVRPLQFLAELPKMTYLN